MNQTANLREEIEQLCKEIEDSNLTIQTKIRATKILQKKLEKHIIKQYNEGCRPDSLN